MRKQKLIYIMLVLMLSFILVFASCNPTTDGDGSGDGGSGDGGSGDGGDGGSGDGGDGGSGDSGDGGSGDGGSTTTYTLTASSSDSNLGEVAIDPATGPYYEGDTITVTATPKSMNNFDGWTGVADADKAKNPLEFAITENMVLTAAFSVPTALTLNSWKEDYFKGPRRWFYINTTANRGYVVYTVDKGMSHPDDPNGGANLLFDNKIGLYKKDGSPYTYYLPVDEDYNHGQIDMYLSRYKIICVAEEDRIYVKVTPHSPYLFVPGVYYLKYNDCQKLTVNLEKGDNVPSDVELSEIGYIEPDAGEHWFEKGSDAKISVTAEDDYYLSEWKDAATGGKDTSVIITMDADKTVGAVIDKLVDQFILTTEVVGGGSIGKNPESEIGGVYAKDTPVQLTPSPADDTWEFEKWVIEIAGEDDVESTDNPLDITMDKSQKVTAYFKLKPQELTLGEWKGGDLTLSKDQWFYFTAVEGKVYELYSHDSYYYHPDNPSGTEYATLDNKVGVYKDNSENPVSYTYTNLEGGYASGQVDLSDASPRPCLEFTAEGTKVWIYVTKYYDTGKGTYWVKVIEQNETPVSLSLTVEGKIDADDLAVSVNYENLTPADPNATQLVYGGINTGRSVLITITPGSDRKVEITGADAGDVKHHPQKSNIGILMDADKALTITFSEKE